MYLTADVKATNLPPFKVTLVLDLIAVLATLTSTSPSKVTSPVVTTPFPSTLLTLNVASFSVLNVLVLLIAIPLILASVTLTSLFLTNIPAAFKPLT